jgi:hypothetical protein
LRRFEAVAVTSAALYVVVLAWAMAATSFDVWGALALVPLLVLVTVPLVRRLFGGELAPLLPYAFAGLAAKFAGAAVRYWVAFDAYGGSADAARYHRLGADLAEKIRSGTVPWSTVVPRGVGTEFVQNLTATVYTFTGPTRLGGFFVFAWFAYLGAVCFVRAAIEAVPGLAQRRYACLVLLLPSLVYWPSSIGKEAWTLLGLGVGSYGTALLVVGRRRVRGLLFAAAGIGAATLARPHVAAIWAVALAVALAAAVLTGSAGRGIVRRANSALLLVLAVLALVGLATFALNYLSAGNEDAAAPVGDRIDEIFAETSRRSSQGGSSFTPMRIDGPQDWPLAITRTLTRPLLFEARSTAELMPAVETTVLLGLALAGWRRLANLPRLAVSTPYLVFSLAVLVMFGLVFTPIGNLGILTRQRSLVLPLLVLPLCLPPLLRPLRPARPVPREVVHVGA